MHDHVTGAMFRVTAANVQTDGVIHNDTWTDWSWDAVWQSQVSTDADGWSVEIRIPLSQLRFPSVERQTWGINALSGSRSSGRGTSTATGNRTA
jgi:hypothetical protein